MVSNTCCSITSEAGEIYSGVYFKTETNRTVFEEEWLTQGDDMEFFSKMTEAPTDGGSALTDVSKKN